ncbi:MAG: SDR family oxidoreductase [Patescibacteria group bacterium]|nr:SDR family oxidoreductase [Patescibacteria group bacterium]
MKILATGLTGLVGSRFTELLSDSYEFEGVSRKTGVDITDKTSVFQKLTSSDAQIVLHLAAKTDVDGCEKDRETDNKFLSQKDFENQEWIRQKTAWVMNVLGTQNIVEACKKNNKKLIYISTDFVFDGNKSQGKGYAEEDAQNPINWYGESKCEGEKIVMNSGLDWIIARLAYPYRASFDNKNDFFRIILQKLRNGQKLDMVTDHVMTPTFIDDFVYAIDSLVKTKQNGIFHTVGNQFISPFDAATLIARKFSLDKNLISQTSRAEYFKDKAQRPFFLGLKNDKIKKMGIEMKSFAEGLGEIKNQII